jgi:hypothetical protein
MYVDDCGKPNKSHRKNKFFGLSAVIINECDWDINNLLVKNLKYSLSIPEIHTRHIYLREKEFQYLNKSPKISYDILEKVFNLISKMKVTLISSIVDKEKYFESNDNDDVETRAWTHLFERCDLEVSDARRRTNSTYDKGLIISDHYTSDNHDERIKDILEFLRIYGSSHHSFKHIIEEPLFTISKMRNMIQIADAVAYCSVNCLLDNEFFLSQFKKIESKFRKSPNGKIENYGFKVYP